MEYYPDVWVVIKITDPKNNETLYKVLAGWNGGFADSDSWQLNSGITRYSIEGDFIEFTGISSSTYTVHRECEKFSSLTKSIYLDTVERLGRSKIFEGVTFEQISFEQFEKEFNNA